MKISSYAQKDTPWFQGYLASFFLTALATVLKWVLFSSNDTETTFLLYFGIVVFISVYYGSKPAVFAVALAILSADYFFLTPWQFIPQGDEALSMLLFVLECGFILILSKKFLKRSGDLAEPREIFRILVEKSTDAIMLVKLDGQIGYSNPSVKNITGYEPEDYATVKLWNLFIQEELTDIKERFYKLASHPGSTVTIVHRIRHKDGRYIWIENSITNLLEDPSVKSIILDFTEVTERVVREKQMEDFIGIASHELKTPLTSLKAYTQVLEMRMKKESNPTSAILVGKIDRQINRVVSMILDLLDVTKMQSGSMNLKKSDFELTELITEVADSIQNTSPKHQIITEAGSPVTIHADRARIAQVLTNLLSNAVKYSPDADTVFLSARVTDGFVTVSVKDQGVGISKAEINHIFDRFYRVNSVKESFQGLGLGLYISSQIIAGHGGEMGVSSEENNGSTFWFRLQINEVPLSSPLRPEQTV